MGYLTKAGTSAALAHASRRIQDQYRTAQSTVYARTALQFSTVGHFSTVGWKDSKLSLSIVQEAPLLTENMAV